MKSRFEQLVLKKIAEKGKAMTWEEVADEIGITRPTVLAWRRSDLKTIHVPTLELICEYLDCEIGDVLYFEKAS